MSVIDEVRREREDLARVLKKHSGIRRTVEDLYPDSAHFIYELLQNAEDTSATEARFTLSKTGLVFEHNGRPFEPQDIYAITDIGEGTKANDEDKIGRFGVGFKAVFAYSETPHIWSPPFAFKITDLVLPSELEPKTAQGNETRFEFPFNNPKKPAGKAYAEVDAGLIELAETTLLFLSHLESIRWQNAAGISGKVLRFKHSENHFEVLKQSGGKTTASSHFLKFDQPVVGLEKQRIAVAYELNYLPNVQAFDPKKALAKQLKITPAAPGRVAVFFPAEKETSGLRFHLHAPFVPELSRASIKKTDANQPLFGQLATLTASSLHRIRDLGLLSVDSLSALPNLQDQVPPRYQGIREAIVREFKNEALTPTKSGSHAPAGVLYRGPARIQEVLDDDDLSQLTQYQSPLWAKNPPQENQREARFLDSLKIEAWGWSELVSAISNCSYDDEERIHVEEWISNKNDAWLLKFYALLGEACDQHDECADVSDLHIVRVVTDEGDRQVTPSEAYFPPEDDATSPPTDVFFVKPAVYASGRSEAQKKLAKSFLETACVRHYDAKAGIERILDQYHTYQSVSLKSHIRHIRQFIKFWRLNPTHISLFREVFFLANSINDVEEIRYFPPHLLCLDSPYEETGLSGLYSIHSRLKVSEWYLSELRNKDLKDFAEFLKAAGVMYRLEVVWQSTWKRGRREELHQDYRDGTRERNPTDDDYTIPKLDEYLNASSIPASRLVWNALLEAKDQVAHAHYAPNSKYTARPDDSWLVIQLRKHTWIPDKTGKFRQPQDMTKDDLRTDFPYDDRNGLLTAICFGENSRKRSEEYQALNRYAHKLDFSSAEEAKEVAKLIKSGNVTLEEIRSLAAQHRQHEFPEKKTSEHRRERIKARAHDAPIKTASLQKRSVQDGYSEDKDDAKGYLRGEYTNHGDLFCQLSHQPMPFKLINGEDWYFEAVECVPNTQCRYPENFLALSPHYAALFKYANHDRDRMHDLIRNAETREIKVRLADDIYTLRFTSQHLEDLKAVLEVDAERQK